MRAGIQALEAIRAALLPLRFPSADEPARLATLCQTLQAAPFWGRKASPPGADEPSARDEITQFWLDLNALPDLAYQKALSAIGAQAPKARAGLIHRIDAFWPSLINDSQEHGHAVDPRSALSASGARQRALIASAALGLSPERMMASFGAFCETPSNARAFERFSSPLGFELLGLWHSAIARSEPLGERAALAPAWMLAHPYQMSRLWADTAPFERAPENFTSALLAQAPGPLPKRLVGAALLAACLLHESAAESARIITLLERQGALPSDGLMPDSFADLVRPEPKFTPIDQRFLRLHRTGLASAGSAWGKKGLLASVPSDSPAACTLRAWKTLEAHMARIEAPTGLSAASFDGCTLTQIEQLGRLGLPVGAPDEIGRSAYHHWALVPRFSNAGNTEANVRASVSRSLPHWLARDHAGRSAVELIFSPKTRNAALAACALSQSKTLGAELPKAPRAPKARL